MWLLLILNAAGVVLATIVFAQLQTTVWYHIVVKPLGAVPAPMLWILPFFYIAIYRTSQEGLLLAFFILLSVAGFTAKPIPSLAINMLLVFLFIHTIKARFYWEGFRYYALIVSLAAGLFHLQDIIISGLFEVHRLTHLLLLDRFIQIILTFLFSFPAYFLLYIVDQSTEKGLYSEPGSQAV